MYYDIKEIMDTHTEEKKLHTIVSVQQSNRMNDNARMYDMFITKPLERNRDKAYDLSFSSQDVSIEICCVVII